MFKVTQVASCRARNGAPMSDTKIPVNNSLSWAPCPPAAESLGLLTKMKSPNPYSVPPVQVSKVWAPLYYLCLLRVGVILLYSMCVCVCVCVCVCALSHYSHVWLCDSKDCSLPNSSVHGILQTRILAGDLLQGIFPTRGWNLCLLCLLHWPVGSLPLAPPHPIPYRKAR